MTEGELRKELFALLDEKYPEIMWTYNPDSRRCLGHKGFPDLVLAGPGGVLFSELKGDTTRFSLEQLAWRKALREAKASWTCWYPEDLTTKIPADLDAIS